MVHFNRLKPCPRDIRLHTSNQLPETRPSDKQSTEVQAQTSQAPPVGTHLEIVEDDDEMPAEHPTTSTTPLSHQPVQLRRNPPRQRHPPARLQDYVRS